jgi:hypothetical protein
MAKYFQVKVEFEIEDGNGKTKKQRVHFLVDSMTVTEAEAKTTKFLTERGEREFEIKSAAESIILDVI